MRLLPIKDCSECTPERRRKCGRILYWATDPTTPEWCPLAEAGVAELAGIRIEIDESLKPGEGYLKEGRSMTEMPDGSWRDLDDLRWVWSWSFSWPWQCSFWSWVHSEWWQNNQTWGWRWFGLTHRAEGK